MVARPTCTVSTSGLGHSRRHRPQQPRHVLELAIHGRVLAHRQRLEMGGAALDLVRQAGVTVVIAGAELNTVPSAA